MTRKALLVLLLFCLVSFSAGFANAADWPTKPLTVIVPWAPGGMTDVSTRMMVEKFKDHLGQPVMVNNQGGAGGITGMKAVLSAAPDGYTFGSGAISSAFAAPFLLNSEPFDMDKVLFIGGYAIQTRFVFASAGRPYKTWEELVAYAKKNPGTVSAGSGGSQTGLDGLKAAAKAAGIKLNFVMFKTGGEASTAMMGGHVDICEVGAGTPAYQAGRQGKLAPLLSLSASRDPFFPDIKAVKEYGYPFAVTSDYGMVMPKATPESIRAKLEKAIHDTLEDKTIQETMANMGFDRKFMTGKEMEAMVRGILTDIPKLSEYVKDVE